MRFATSRRGFTDYALASVLAAFAVSTTGIAASAQRLAAGPGAGRRQVIKQMLSGKPERELILVEITYAPGEAAPAHMHPNGVMAYVVSGAIASRVNDGPDQIYHAGDAWWEPVGAIHHVSRNASATEPATLLAIFVAPQGASGAELTKPL